MELIILGSGSSGNSYILQNKNTAIILDAGIPVKKAIHELGYDSSKIVGILLSHSHGDHSKYIKEYLKMGIDCYAHSSTWDELRIKNNFAKKMDDYEKNHKSIMIGEFLIMPFKLIHDVCCLGYQITYPDMGNTIFMTDTKYSPYLFSNVTNWIIECNHSEKILMDNAINGKITSKLMNRIEDNHMSYENMVHYLCKSDLSITNKIILIHLSEMNSNSDDFRNGVIEMFGKDAYVAKKGLKLDLTKEL